MTLRSNRAGSRQGYALVIFLVLMGLVAALLAANWATIRGLHREAVLLDRRQTAHWTNSAVSPATNNPAAAPPVR